MDYIDAIVNISIAEKRIRRILKKLEKQRKKLYSNVKKAVADGDEISARNYALRIVFLVKQERKFQKLLDYLEQAKLKVEKASIFSELKPIMGILEKVSSEEFEEDQLDRILRELELAESIKTGTIEDEELAEKIIQQAKAESIKELEELLPSPEKASEIEIEEK